MVPSASEAFTQAPVPIAVVGIQDKVIAEVRLVNEAFAVLLNTDAGQLTGQRLADLVHPDDMPLLDAPVETLADPTQQVQVRMVRNGWGVVWTVVTVALGDIDRGEADSAIIALQDVTQWRRAEEELAHRATHDALTGLANRSLLMDHLERALAKLGRRSGTVAVLFCDLDGFKHLNDTFGHRIGDTVLQEAANRIHRAVRREDVVVRMGGDEFVIVCEAPDSSEAGQVAERVRLSLEAPVRVGERDFSLSISIGIAQVSENSASAEDLVRRSDLAMYRAKQRGRNRTEFFAPEMEDQARSRVEMVERIRRALQADEVTIDLQPIIDLATGEWVGSEALARIRQPGTAPLLPSQFLLTSAKAGLLERIDTRVREQAMRWMAGRAASGHMQPGWVSVNVTGQELGEMRFAGTIEAELDAYGLRADQLMFELSEPAVGPVAGSTLVTLRRLQSMGCLVALDDFGAGCSSLTSVRDLPADLVKIDQSFVAGLGHDGEDEAIVSAIITMAHRLGRRVAAEGVEHPVQVDVLKRLGCNYGQGYLFGPPNPPALAERAE